MQDKLGCLGGPAGPALDFSSDPGIEPCDEPHGGLRTQQEVGLRILSSPFAPPPACLLLVSLSLK